MLQDRLQDALHGREAARSCPRPPGQEALHAVPARVLGLITSLHKMGGLGAQLGSAFWYLFELSMAERERSGWDRENADLETVDVAHKYTPVLKYDKLSDF